MRVKSNRVLVEQDRKPKFGLNNNPKKICQKNRFRTNVLYSDNLEKPKIDPFKTVYNARGFLQSKAKVSSMKRLNKKTKLAKFTEDFFHYTTIGGLKRVFGKNRLKKWHRLLWAIIWMALVYFIYFLCNRHISNYYTFKVDTRIHYETMTSLDFPAITMCNENLFRKSIVGGSFTAMVMWASSITSDPKTIHKIATENNKSCYQPHIHRFAKKFEKEGFALLTNLGFKKFMRIAAMDSDVVAVKCWWQNVEMECSKVLLNRVSDFNLCFSFNPSKHFLAEKSDRIEPIRDNYVKRQSTASGDRQGFRILLNANQAEYCGASRKYFLNPGFVVKLHDPEIMPYIDADKSIYVGPGFSYKILLRPTIVQRRTEQMGKCLSTMKSMLYPDISGYFQDACKVEAMAKLIWDKCQCYPFQYDGVQADISRLVNVPQSELSSCLNNGMPCILRVSKNLSRIPVESIFPQCKKACREVHYECVISKSRIPSIAANEDLQGEYNFTNVKDVRKNAILADFYFETMTMLIIEEYQMYTLLDVFRNFGGVLSLFLGVSVITLGEVVYIMLYWFIFYAEFLLFKIAK